MSKYIDTEKLIAEIERLQKFNNSMSNNAINSNMRNFYDGEEDCCKQLLSFITSLQQEQTQVADASKMERLNVDDLHEWSMRYAPGFREMIEATAYHFWNLAICSRKEK